MASAGKIIIGEIIKGECGAETLDHWTSKDNINYVTQTFHFINSSWQLKALTLTCEVHSGGSTGTKEIIALQTRFD